VDSCASTRSLRSFASPRRSTLKFGLRGTTDPYPAGSHAFGRRARVHRRKPSASDGGNGGPNDTYGIIVSNGYASRQQELGGGNVNIHKS
jgi:hypothetical protein